MLLQTKPKLVSHLKLQWQLYIPDNNVHWQSLLGRFDIFGVWLWSIKASLCNLSILDVNNGGNINTTNNAVIDQVKQGRTRVGQNVNVTASTINYLASYTKNINQVAFFPTFWDHVRFWFLYLSNVSEKGSRRTDLIQMEKYHLQLVCVSGLPERLWLICGLDFQLFAVFRWLLISVIIDQAIAERVDLPP